VSGAFGQLGSRFHGLSEDEAVAEHDDDPEPAAVPRVIDRLRDAGLSEDNIQQHFQAAAIGSAASR
jgi:hypothetical protein